MTRIIGADDKGDSREVFVGPNGLMASMEAFVAVVKQGNGFIVSNVQEDVSGGESINIHVDNTTGDDDIFVRSAIISTTSTAELKLYNNVTSVTGGTAISEDNLNLASSTTSGATYTENVTFTADEMATLFFSEPITSFPVTEVPVGNEMIIRVRNTATGKADLSLMLEIARLPAPEEVV